MATEYAHQPVVFLEYYPHTGPAPTRQTRYTAAAGYGAAHPWAMVSSGFKWAAGAGDYATIYRGMINADLPRPAQLDLRAWYRRDGNTLRLYARVHNTSGLTLHSPDNDSRLWGLALEENSTAAYSGRKALRAEFDGIAFLDPGGVSTHALNLSIPTGANWNNVRSVVMVEYRPGGGSGPYDVLHAVRPRPADFTLSQDSLHFNLPEGSNTAEIRFDGPPVLEWTALAHVPWLQVAPWAGTMEQPAQVQVLPGHLPSGDHEGEITFAATSPDGMFFEVVLPVSVTMDQEAPVQHFPGVAGLPGQGGTRWRSSLTLANPFPSEREVLVELQARGTGVTVASHTFTPAAGELIFISDIYQHFDAPSGAGSLRLTGDAYAWVRTFNQADEGTFGQDVVGTGEGLWQDGQGVLFPINQPADPNVDFRSNLLLLNLEDRDITAHVTAGDSAVTVPVPAGTYVQVNGLGGELGLPAGPALVRVEADGAWTGSVSTVDGVTGDPTTVRGLLEPAEE